MGYCPRINCVFATLDGRCNHPDAPRPLFGRATCLLAYPPSDPRIASCAVQVTHNRPPAPPPVRP